MTLYYYIAAVAIISQVLFLLVILRNGRYLLKKYHGTRDSYRPRTLLVVPCKGVDVNFEKNIASFFSQQYDDYILWFVVAAKSDPAYGKLCRLKDELSESSRAGEVRILTAGDSRQASQKNHNLLYCYRQMPGDIEVLAFADSDICVRDDWLCHIVHPLRKANIGAASGYRWFIPVKNNTATLAMSGMNAKVAQLLGNSRCNQAWGGSMAIKVDTFRKIGLDELWQKAISDDYCLTYAVKKAKLKIEFVPACLVASYEKINWAGLFEFGRRQFLITRINRPVAWWSALAGSLYLVAGVWGAGTAAGMATDADILWTVPFVFLAGQFARAVMRQRIAGKIFSRDRKKMAAAMIADIGFCWLFSLLFAGIVICSGFGRTIGWRGIRYKMLGPGKTVVIK